MQPNDITFFQRFQDDILAGRKTITIRDAAESHFKTGDALRVGRYEDDGYFCTIRVVGTSTVTLDTLTELHAQQENMTLAQLREVIAEIYPEEKQFYVIEFEKL
ncbi:TPA: N(4)-acetylcytidine aminohydrolase [Klebsiella oxytoca]